MFVQYCSYNYILRASTVGRLNAEDWAISANLSTRKSDQAKKPQNEVRDKNDKINIVAC